MAAARCEGTATTAGRFAFDVVAINHNDRSARMKVTLDVREASKPAPSAAPPAPAQASVDLEPATVGAPYSARAAAVPLQGRADAARRPWLPEGLAFADLGGGLSQLAGAPAKAGRFAFDVVATSPSGAEGRMTVRIEVAPAPTPTAEPSPRQPRRPPGPAPDASPSVADAPRPGRARSCGASTPVRASSPASSTTIRAGARFVGIGADRAAFDSFAADYQKAFQRDARASRRAGHAPANAPLVELLMKLPAASATRPPRLTLDSADGRRRPAALGRRHRTRAAGAVCCWRSATTDARSKCARKSATTASPPSFSLGMTGDAASVGKPQLLVALASDRPFAGLEDVPRRRLRRI